MRLTAKAEREAKFDLLLANSIKITGIIDRVDRLTDGSVSLTTNQVKMSLTFKILQ